MTTLTFHPFARIVDHFTVAPDLTAWNRKHFSTRGGMTPQRERATYRGIQHVLRPVTPRAQALERALGLYLLAFDLPSPSLYVGIAARSATPEGVLRRIRKHCIKAMGSHVGSENSTGGVHHPAKWQMFAVDRHTHLQGVADTLADARVTHAELDCAPDRGILEAFEHHICSNREGVMDAICDRLWPGLPASQVRLLTSNTVRRRSAPEGEFRIELA